MSSTHGGKARAMGTKFGPPGFVEDFRGPQNLVQKGPVYLSASHPLLLLYLLQVTITVCNSSQNLCHALALISQVVQLVKLLPDLLHCRVLHMRGLGNASSAVFLT